MTKIEDNVRDEAKGFLILFLSYVQKLFLNKGNLDKSESSLSQFGPKQILTVLSRYPFSDMYKKLPEESQKDIQNYWKNLCKENTCEIAQLRNWNQKTMHVTLQQWIDSIQDPSDARNSEKKIDYQVDALSSVNVVGLLSSSMGEYYNVEDNNPKALIEMRQTKYHYQIIKEERVQNNEEMIQYIKDRIDEFFPQQ